MAKRDPSKPKKNPFAADYAPYGTYTGEPGNPRQWKAAYSERMSAKEADEVLSGTTDTIHAILGLKIGATQDEIKAAFRAMVFKVHPDHGGDAAAFIRVKAAYSKLMEEFD